MRLLVYEHISGGGFAQQPIPADVLSQGYGMLRALISDMKKAKHEVTVLLDARISSFSSLPAADCTVPVFHYDEPKRFLSALARLSDAVYVIAPETNRTLESIVEIVEKAGKASLNCESSAIKQVVDKAHLHEALKAEGLPTPKTVQFNVNDDLAKVKRVIKSEMGYPLILKPSDGTSCNGLSIIKEEMQVKKGIEKIRSASSSSHFIAQEQINGEAASVSLISTGSKTLPISLNKQNVTLATVDAASSYNGGYVPFEHPLKSEALALAEKAVNLFPGLKGYVGVDLVLTRYSPVVVDVNPRLTTSYIALSKVAQFNVAETMLNATLKGNLSENEIKGFAYFSTIETDKPSIQAFQKSLEINGVVCPPFPLKDSPKSCSLIAAQGDNLNDASARLKETKKRLIDIVGGG